jgi:predicted nuclease of predicted toxin-antitoxin system
MKFLVDVNLPKHFSFFNYANFIHVVDIDPYMTDKQVWDYALENGYVVLTKDADFYFKCVSSQVSPKVIQFKLGNMSMRQLHKYFTQYWEELVKQIKEASLVLAERDKLTVLSWNKEKAEHS